MKITDQIKTVEIACAAIGTTLEEELPFPSPVKARQCVANAFVKCIIVIEALNEGWKPSWNDWNERKYFIWWDLNAGGSGPGFSFVGVGYAYSHSYVGSRLVFRTRELAEFAAKQFPDIFREWMLIESQVNTES